MGKTLPPDDRPPKVVIEQVVMDGGEFADFGFHVSGEEAVTSILKPEASNLKLAPGRARLVQFRYTAPTFVNLQIRLEIKL